MATATFYRVRVDYDEKAKCGLFMPRFPDSSASQIYPEYHVWDIKDVERHAGTCSDRKGFLAYLEDISRTAHAQANEEKGSAGARPARELRRKRQELLNTARTADSILQAMRSAA